MKRILAILTCLCLIVLVMPMSLFAATSAGDANVHMNVVGCNNNALCEANLGENSLSCPIDCTAQPQNPSGSGDGSGGGSGYIFPLEFYDIVVTPLHTSAALSWKTKTNALTTFSWGRTPDYDEGSASEVSFVKNHSVKIENLIPGTKYYFKIVGRDAAGVYGTHEGTFQTTFPPDLTPPANVTNLTLTQNKTKNLLKWVNPTDTDFAFVRVLRSTRSYPYDVLSGRIVYEGGGNYTYDEYVDENTIYYYTIFARDTSGNFSSGASIKSTLQTPSGSTATSTPSINPYKNITLKDFEFIQRDVRISFINNTIPIQSEDLLTLHMLSTKLTTKPYLLLLEIGDEPSFQTLLMREYFSKNAYETIVNLGNFSWESSFTINFINEKLETVHTIDGTFLISPSSKINDQIFFKKINNVINQHPYMAVLIISLLLALLLLLILLILWINRRRKRAILIPINEPVESTKKL